MNKDQAKRLLSGMLGAISELKSYPMLEIRVTSDGRRSTVPGFDRTLTHLFPEVEEDSHTADYVAERMLLLRRRIEDDLSDLLAEPDEALPQTSKPKRRWWPFGKQE
jgi:hypothetical protein